MSSPKRKTNGMKIVLLCITIALSAFFTIYSQQTAFYVKEALKLCFASVIPSLFPFMVLSSLASKTASRLTGKQSEKTAVILSFFLGALCGFPVGAATVASMYKNNSISKEKAEYLCAFCNNTGPAFVIGVIGTFFWKNKALGILFYMCQIMSAASVFVVCKTIFCKRIFALYYTNAKPHCKQCSSCKNQFSANDLNSFTNAFCSSVADSAISVIQICGYIVFFMVICKTVRLFLPASDTSNLIYTVLSAILEFTTGTNNAASVGGSFGVFVCGFSIGFSGLSVIAQSSSLLIKAGLCPTPMIVLKFIIGIVSGILSIILYSLIDLPETISVSATELHLTVLSVLSFLIIASALFCHLTLRIRSFITNRR